MDKVAMDLRGRMVAHAFMDELEKIAIDVRRALGELADYGAARSEALAQVPRARETFGWRRFIPFTESHRAFSGLKRSAFENAASAERGVSDIRRSAYALASSPDPLERKAAMDLIEASNKAGPGSSLENARRRLGIESAPPEPETSSLARNAMMVGLPMAVGAGGLYAAQQYMAPQSDPYAM